MIIDGSMAHIVLPTSPRYRLSTTCISKARRRARSREPDGGDHSVAVSHVISERDGIEMGESVDRLSTGNIRLIIASNWPSHPLCSHGIDAPWPLWVKSYSCSENQISTMK